MVKKKNLIITCEKWLTDDRETKKHLALATWQSSTNGKNQESEDKPELLFFFPNKHFIWGGKKWGGDMHNQRIFFTSNPEGFSPAYVALRQLHKDTCKWS